jgi:20S proteasome subunit alpha 6
LSSIFSNFVRFGFRQEKVFKIDKHLGVSVTGLIADARVLCKYMHSEALNHRFVFGSDIQVARIAQDIADKSQVFTQKSSKRPYGVGLLIAGYDKTGPHLFETCPSGNYYEFHAQVTFSRFPTSFFDFILMILNVCVRQALGARSQAARTYLERNFTAFDACSLDQLIVHALTGLLN